MNRARDKDGRPNGDARSAAIAQDARFIKLDDFQTMKQPGQPGRVSKYRPNVGPWSD